jgi:RNAse (barnase) inhibitor barstar
MPTVPLDGRRIADWKSFHDECRAAFGFPDFYGRNMDAWIDCLGGLRDDDGMTKFALRDDETLCIEVLHSGFLRQKAPEILEALEECTAEVNERCIESGQKPPLSLQLR